MVGAGFSLNAQPHPGVADQFPTWGQLAWDLFSELYPASISMTNDEKSEREKNFDRTSPMRLASEYEATFQRNLLNQKIVKSIPDNLYSPGLLHQQLMQLPWRDVYTTNYDTLLERTDILERPYQVVNRQNELTTSGSPRIIKLHGSFPDYTPFIVTEEDYRTYPDKFAPFVNTVQQALLESSPTLIGFSGDDPNFLQWIGWIRDKLGKSQHLSIYLISVNSFSDAQRHLLRERGVKVVDLSYVVRSCTSSSNPHAIALEWFFLSILAAKPPRAGSWLEAESELKKPDGLPDLLVSADRSVPPKLQSKVGYNDEDLITLIQRWRYERQQYPGWLVAPYGKRESIIISLSSYISLLINSTEHHAPFERVLTLFELNWRIEVAMIPLFEDTKKPMNDAVTEAYSLIVSGDFHSLQNLKAPFYHVTVQDIVESWLSLAFALLREARETFNEDEWKNIASKISRVQELHRIALDRTTYEKVLWKMWNIDFQSARLLLHDWDPSPVAPIGLMWKGGLLAELDLIAEAKMSLQAALDIIRKSQKSQGINYELLSLEGWCSYSLSLVEFSNDPMSYGDIRKKYISRWDELGARDCNPNTVFEYFRYIFKTEAPKPHASSVSNFTFDGISTRYKLVDDSLVRILPAFSHLRLFEQTAMPMRLKGVNPPTTDVLNLSCEWISRYIDNWSPAILVRAGFYKFDESLFLLTRPHVRTMGLEVAQRLHSWGLSAFRNLFQSLSVKTGSGTLEYNSMQVLTEFLSRLVFRQEEAGVRANFESWIDFHSSEMVGRDRFLSSFSEKWLSRILKKMAINRVLELLPRLIDTPLPLNLSKTSFDAFLIACSHLRSDSIGHPESASPDFIQCVKKLLAVCEVAIGEERVALVTRLAEIHRIGGLSSDKYAQFSAILWDGVDPGELPPYLQIHRYLYLPTPSDIDVDSIVREKILSSAPQTTVQIGEDGRMSRVTGGADPLFLSIISSTMPVVEGVGFPNGKLEWREGDALVIWQKILDWWVNEKPGLGGTSDPSLFSSGIVQNLSLVDEILAMVLLPNLTSTASEFWNELDCFLEDMHTLGLHFFCTPYILIQQPERAGDVASSIAKGLNSSTEKEVVAAATSLKHWVVLSKEQIVDGGPVGELLTIANNRLVARRSVGYRECMEVIGLLLTVHPEFFDVDVVNMLSNSLVAWDENTQDDESSTASEGYEAINTKATVCRMLGAIRHWYGYSGVGVPQILDNLNSACCMDADPRVSLAINYFDGYKDEL